MVERRIVAACLALFALAGCHSARVDEGSVDTTLPNDTAVIASNADAMADNIEMQADNMDAMADNMSAQTPMYPTDPESFGQPQYGAPQQAPAAPTIDTSPPYGGQSAPANGAMPN